MITDVKQVIAQLVKDGAERINGVVVRNATYSGNYMVYLTLNQNVTQYVKKNDEWVLSKDNRVRTSLYSIGAVLSDVEGISVIKDKLMKCPNLLSYVLDHATVDIILEEVVEGQEYTNPFTTKGEDARVTTFEHNDVVCHVIGIAPSRGGMKWAEKIADKQLDEAYNNSISKKDE